VVGGHLTPPLTGSVRLWSQNLGCHKLSVRHGLQGEGVRCRRYMIRSEEAEGLLAEGAMAMSTVEERIEILKAEYQRLEQYLRPLSQEDWNHPSTCDQWTVADVIAHLTVGNQHHAAWIIEALQADSVTSERLPRRSNQRVDAIAFAQRVIAWRQELGTHLLSEFVTTSRALAQAFEQVAPDDWEKLCYRPNGAEPIRTILDNFIAEVGVHRWDVMSPFDPHVQLSQDCLAVMVERYPH